MWLHTDLSQLKANDPNLISVSALSKIPTNMNTCRYEASLITHSSGLLPSDVCASDFFPIQFTWVEESGVEGVVGTWGRRLSWLGGGGWASLLPPCSWLHCAAAVSAGMAPLTICSLIANIRVHFLRHWSGTERWRAELWAFLSLPLCLSRSCSILPGDGGRTHKHTRTHTHELDRRPLTHPAYLYCPAVSNTPSISKHTQVQQWMDAFLLNLPCELTLSHIIHRWCTYVLSTSLIQNFIKSEFVKMIYFLYDVNDILCVSQDVFCFFFLVAFAVFFWKTWHHAEI